MDTLLNDLRYGFRRLRKSPAFTTIALLTLALGIGANTSMFTIVNAVLLKALPFRDPGQIVFVREVPRQGTAPFGGVSISLPNLEDYRQQQHAFDALSAWVSQSVNLTGQEHPDRVIGAFVSSNFFSGVFEAKADRGRTFLPGEDQPGSQPVVVISNAVWKSRFGSDPNILGRKLTLNGEMFTVVGVLPENFTFPLGDIDVWLPIHHYPNYKIDRAQRAQLVMGRIHSGVSRAEAREQLNVIAQRIAAQYPEAGKDFHIELTGASELNTQNVRTSLLVLLGAVGLILLIAASNIANLLLARSLARTKEIAVRVALGASRSDLIRQLLAEALLLSVTGGMVGLLLAQWVTTFVVKSAPSALPLNAVPGLDLRVLAFTIAISVLTGIFFGLLPAWQSSNPDLRNTLASAGGRGTESAGNTRLRNAFVISQVAISVVLLVGAGLLIRSFRTLLHVDPGFDSRNLLTAEYRLPRNKYPTIEEQWNFHKQVVENARQIPGVVSAATVLGLPFSGNFGAASFSIPGQPAPEKGIEPAAIVNFASPEYFSTIGLSLLQGRGFDERDTQKSPKVVVINRTFAEKYWPKGEAVGNRIHEVDDNFDATVIGVVNDSKYLTLREEPGPAMYFPSAQNDRQIFATLVLRTAVEPTALSDELRQSIWRVDPDQPVWKIRTVEFLIDRDLSSDKFVMLLMIAFASLALVLTAIGTYGVISYSVTQRTQEIGLRMALGATWNDVLGLVVKQGMKLSLIGIAIGAVGALAGARLMQKLLFKITATDPLTFAAVLAVLLLVAFIACYLPARRAASVDPIVALRYE
jgi:putative ABC transport system permease protein